MNDDKIPSLMPSGVSWRVSPSAVSGQQPDRRTFVSVCRARRATAESLGHSISGGDGKRCFLADRGNLLVAKRRMPSLLMRRRRHGLHRT